MEILEQERDIAAQPAPAGNLVNWNALSIAPMMDYTDRHFRYLMRQLTRRTVLYTEMVTSAAILHGDRQRLLGFSVIEKPLVLQIGGDNPADLAECCRIAEDMGYDGVNLNVGCPSSRVQDGHFGACLMAKPEQVAACVTAMQAATALPISVKHRIGIDDCDRYEDLANFVRIVSAGGCEWFTVHARKAWLKGLNPKENRTIPPLRYGDVYRLKQDFPHLGIEINGGILTLAEAQEHLQQVDAVMIGRAAYDNPYLFATADSGVYPALESAFPTDWDSSTFSTGLDTAQFSTGWQGSKKTMPGSSQTIFQQYLPASRADVVTGMLPYMDAWLTTGGRLNQITRHMLQLFAGQPGSRYWKRQLTEGAATQGADTQVVTQALETVLRFAAEATVAAR